MTSLLSGNPLGSTRFAERKDDTSESREDVWSDCLVEEDLDADVGDVAADFVVRSSVVFSGEADDAGIAGIGREVLSGGVSVPEDVDGRDAASFSRTWSDIATICWAIFSNSRVTATYAVLTLQLSRPPIAISAYVLLRPRARGSLRRKTYAMV